jgi:cell division protein FtsB
MRVGTAILLPLLALFGFGFFLAFSFNLSRELIETRNQLTGLQTEKQALEAKYQALIVETNRLTGQVSGLTSENEDLRRRIDTLEVERVSLTHEIETLQGQLALAQKANSLFAWLVSGPAERSPLALLVIVPMLPLSLGTAYVIGHHKGRRPPVRPANRLEPSSATFQGLLTREEFHIIAQYRKLRPQAGSGTS